MNPKYKNIVFLDVDGCLTSMEDHTSYLNCGDEENYGISGMCLDLLKNLIEEHDCGVVISSNWRLLEASGREFWEYKGVKYKNHLPQLREIFGERYCGTIPCERHCTKAECLIMWFEDHEDWKGNYVVFDDDLDENFHLTTDHGIRNHFVKCDERYGINLKNIEEANQILKGDIQ